MNSPNWAMVADCVEYGEWKSGKRSEAITYSAFTYFRKLSQAVAGFIPGVVLALVGYVPNAVQTQAEIFGIRGLMFIYLIVMSVLTVVVISLLYPLTDRYFIKVSNELKDRNHAKANA